MKFIEKACQTSLFRGMTTEETEKILRCTGAVLSEFEDGDTVVRGDDPIHRLGVIVSGNASSVRYTADGNRAIIARLHTGDIFGFRLPNEPSEPDSTVCASGRCSVLLLDANKLIFGCEACCQDHRRLYRNLVFLLAVKNRDLTQTLCHLSQRTLRGKIMSYLDEQAQRQDSRELLIPFDRQELADYLAADRSALSAELSRMKRDGIIDYRKNNFRLL